MLNNLTTSYDSLEILFSEIHGRNKSTQILLCAAYQSSSNKAKTLEWLERFELLLANIYATGNGLLTVTDNFDMNLLGNQESVKRLKDITHTFSLQQHVDMAGIISSKLVRCDVINIDEISDHVN